jgi:hypothetical protein
LSNIVLFSLAMAQDHLPTSLRVVDVVLATTTVAVAVAVVAVVADVAPVDMVQIHLHVPPDNCVARRDTRFCAATSALMPRSRGRLTPSWRPQQLPLRMALIQTGTLTPVQLITSRVIWRSCP